MTRRRPRRRIEIYFVLYLVALVLLLPDRPEPGGLRDVAVISSDISLELRPERLKMECTLLQGADGSLQLVRIDSANTIHYSGDLTEVNLRARIEDDRTGQVITLEPGGDANALFQLIPQPERRAVVFVWRPLRADRTSHKFRVTILGTGIPMSDAGPNGGERSALPPGLRVSGSTQFVVETRIDAAPDVVTLTEVRRDTVVQVLQPGGNQRTGAFWVGAASPTIRVAPGGAWTNRLSFGGAEPMRDLKGLPRVSVNRSGVVVERFLDSTQQAVILRGRALSSGAYTVTVRAERDDGEVRETSFDVETQRVDRPMLPGAVYSGLAYRIDPRLPDAPGVKATLKVDGRAVVSTTDGVLKFQADRDDEGKRLTLERTMDGELMESPLQITIQALPAPEIREVKNTGNGNVKRVIVLYYGDKAANRPTLEIVDGNAAPPQKLFGNQRAADPNDADAMRWLEDFDVRRADGSKPFTFRMRAKDGRGRYSPEWVVD